MQYFLLNCINILYVCIFIRKLFVSLSLIQDNKSIKVVMGKWNNFFLQRMGSDSNNAPYPIFESVSIWGIFCKDIPFKLFDKVKAPAKRSWFDEHGDDEYIPASGLFLDAYTMKVEFACKKGTDSMASVNDVRTNVANFLTYLRQSGLLKLYSSHTKIGRQNVRLDSVSDNAKWISDDNAEFLIFDVTFKVDDPVTDITLG